MRSSKRKGKKNQSPIPVWRTRVIGIACVVVFGYLAYAAWIYQSSEGAKEGIVACGPDKHCTLSVHWHAALHAETCGKKIIFSLEEGELGEQHTHKERDLVHIHTTLPYDPPTKTVTSWAPLKIANFFQNMGMRFSSSCLGDFCSGQVCPDGKPQRLVMQVNGEQDEHFENYEWRDGDEIIIKTVPE